MVFFLYFDNQIPFAEQETIFGMRRESLSEFMDIFIEEYVSGRVESSKLPKKYFGIPFDNYAKIRYGEMQLNKAEKK